MKIFENVAQLILARLGTGQLVKTKGYYTANDGGGAEYIIVASGTGTDDGGSYLDLALNQAELITEGFVTLSEFGYTSGSPKSIIEAIALSGNKLTKGEQRPSTYPVKNIDRTPYLCYLEDANTVYTIGASDSDAGYNLLVFKNNITTTNNSLAATAADATMYRITSAVHAVWVAVGFRTQTSQTGTWSLINLNQVTPMPVFNSSERYQYLQNNSNSTESLTYAGVEVINGFVKLSFVATASSNPAVSINVDGTVYTVDLTQGATSIQTYTFPVSTKQAVDVTITNSSAGAFYFVNFLGFWFSELKDWSGATVDAYGYYRNTALHGEYLSSNSENDYVVREYNSDIYGGGYHGGESSIVDQWKDGANNFTPTSAPVVTKNLKLESSCNVNWNSVGQNTVIDVDKKYTFSKSSYYLEVVLDGAFEAVELYSTLFGVNEQFANLTFPLAIDLATDVADLERKEIGRTSKVVYKNSTGQTFEADITLSGFDVPNQYDGAFVWRVDGSYKKLYYTPVHDGYLSLDNGYASINKFSFL
jgi:hypothetical protein